jgi:predicted cupin superfamily sugar epimerase
MADSENATHWIERLRLVPHPEGGWFRETYRASETIARAALPERFQGARAFSTAIYYLLPSDEVSRLHRLRSDELWYFHAGSALVITVLQRRAGVREIVLGRDVERGETLQAVMPAGAWFGAYVRDAGSFTLAGCTVAPGFDYGDFELGDRATLLREFPGHAAVIARLT